jgi:nicotinamide phosphoribosyltransferase
MKNFMPFFYADYYKTSHPFQYPEGLEMIYSNMTPRSSRVNGQDKVVVFGIQYFVKEYLIKQFNENFFNRPKQEVLDEYQRIMDNTLGKGAITVDHIAKLHDLGYLPIKLKALPEGTMCPLKVPVLTIRNTHVEFAWLTNYLETLLSNITWLPMTSATTAHIYREVFNKYADETVGDRSCVQWQGHDFSMRGLTSIESACTSGAAHLLSFTGTDTIPAITFLEEYYGANTDNELVGGSVPASEHATCCIGSVSNENGEIGLLERIITEVYPKGIVSFVSDTWDFWAVLTDFLPRLKDKILARDGKLVIRPDSGDPVRIIVGDIYPDYTKNCTTLEDAQAWAWDDLTEKIMDETPHGEHGESNPECIFKFQDKYYRIYGDIEWNRHDKQYYYMDGNTMQGCDEVQLTPDQKGAIEVLWEVFGGKVNELGYKELDPHIGLIYGDSITMERQKQILEGLKQKGFASNNVVLGIGSFTYQYCTRDTYGFAMKATYGEVLGKPYNIFKDPKTDDGMKKSAKGLLAVIKSANGSLELKQEVTWDVEASGELQTVFFNGKLENETTLAEIRGRLNQ